MYAGCIFFPSLPIGLKFILDGNILKHNFTSVPKRLCAIGINRFKYYSNQPPPPTHTHTHTQTHTPLFGLLYCVPPALLLQPASSLLQLGEGVGGGVGGHGGVLDEEVGGLHLGGCGAGDGGGRRRGVVPQLGRDPGVDRPGALHRGGPRGLVTAHRPPGAAGAAAGRAQRETMSA